MTISPARMKFISAKLLGTNLGASRQLSGEASKRHAVQHYSQGDFQTYIRVCQINLIGIAVQTLYLNLTTESVELNVCAPNPFHM